MVKIKTEVLKSMVEKASKVINVDKMSPLTELMEINISGEEVTITATDTITTMVVKGKIEGNQENVRVVVDAKKFNMLISKMTCNDIELMATSNVLTVDGNGTYYLDVRIDESGEIIKFPELNLDITKPAIEFNFLELSRKINVCKPSIPDDYDQPELNNYLLKETISATNSFKATIVNNIPELKGQTLFITKDLGRIITELGYLKAKYYTDNDNIFIYGDGFVIKSNYSIEQLSNYPLENINASVNQGFKYKAMVDRKAILNLLDRVLIFVDEYDSNVVKCLFTKDKLKITNKKKTANEDIRYKESVNDDSFVEFSCNISIIDTKQQLDALTSDFVEVSFGGADNAIKVIDGEVTQLISLLDDEF